MTTRVLTGAQKLIDGSYVDLGSVAIAYTASEPRPCDDCLGPLPADYPDGSLCPACHRDMMESMSLKATPFSASW